MFERRLKIFLGIIFGLATVILAKAVYLQVFQREKWQNLANAANERPHFLGTSRGRIWDRNRVAMAFDDPCVDAAVDYRAIALDDEWIKAQAKARLRGRATGGDSAAAAAAAAVPARARERMLADEIEHVKADIDAMWPKLAAVTGKSIEEIEETRQAVKWRISWLGRREWYYRFQKNVRAATQASRETTPRWMRWLVDARQDDPTKELDDRLDGQWATIHEQLQTHVIVANLDNDQQIALRKIMPQCPGLELRESMHRRYGDEAAVAAAHVLGHLGAVNPKDLESKNGTLDELRQYNERDLIGRGGLEELAEPLLRGTRGKVLGTPGRPGAVEEAAPQPGHDVTCSIDVALQADIVQSFKAVETNNKLEHKKEVLHDLHGAVVVLDVKTNEVLVLASCPSYDANQYDAQYEKLKADDLNAPLLNRATRAQHEPGSTVKTIIGSMAITQGFVGAHEGLECNGYLEVPDWHTPGKTIRLLHTNRCWVASQFEHQLGIGGVAHHPVPIPHKGRYGNPDGSLIVADALERSCNVFFEKVGDRMQIAGVSAALSRFGLGRKTDIGIAEATGSIPDVHPILPGKHESDPDRRTSWLAAIGQGEVTATPIQMANVAATLARGGIRMRPRLLTGESGREIYGPIEGEDLKLSAAGLAEVKEGMIAVVNSDSGTGEEPRRNDMIVAGKTGSAQASKLRIPVRDQTGEIIPMRDKTGAIIYDTDKKSGKPYRRPTTEIIEPNRFEWYQGVGEGGQHLAHAWFIGYAPADHPQIAFCVFVDYGGSGGKVAGAIASQVIEACVEHKYLQPGKVDLARTASAAAQ
jgi:penicillin-binding protein 2